MRKYSVEIAHRHATSISLEEEFYKELCKLAAEQNISVKQLITEIDETRTNPNLSSALRLYVLEKLLAKLAQQSD